MPVTRITKEHTTKLSERKIASQHQNRNFSDFTTTLLPFSNLKK
jgi:hypothetical protein